MKKQYKISKQQIEPKKDSPKYPICEIEWLDAQSGFGTPWTLEELESVEPAHTFSVGYLLKEDKEKIILGFMMFGDEGMFKHWQLIPRGMIKKITKLRGD